MNDENQTLILPWVRSLRREDIVPLREALAADAHRQWWNPNFVVEGAESRLMGCASIGTVPFVNVWLDSKRVKARQTVRIIAELENQARVHGFKMVAVPCAAESPLFGYMERLGYVQAHRPTFIKSLLTSSPTI